MVGLSGQTKLCPLCSAQLKKMEEISCEECGRPNLGAPAEGTCHDCVRWKKVAPWDTKAFHHRALYYYDPFIQEVLTALKYRGDVALGELFSPDLKSLGKKIGSFDFVTYIPLKEGRHWERGFNQAEVLARSFAAKPLVERVGVSSNKQSKRTREERILAMKNAFVLSVEGRKENYSGKRILIVDDIYTTGATLRSAASLFYEAGAEFVAAVTVARAVGSKARKKMK